MRFPALDPKSEDAIRDLFEDHQDKIKLCLAQPHPTPTPCIGEEEPDYSCEQDCLRPQHSKMVWNAVDVGNILQHLSKMLAEF